jgi:hypothetical protein
VVSELVAQVEESEPERGFVSDSMLLVPVALPVVGAVYVETAQTLPLPIQR